MSRDIAVNITRVNTTTPALSGIALQLDNLPFSERLYYEGAAPIEHFEAYALGVYDIRQTDILTDTVNIDPVTSANYQYRVVSVPESFPDFHMEMIVSLLRGGV